MNPKFEKYAYGVIKEYSPRLLLERNTWHLNYGVENPESLMECVFNYPYLGVTLNYGDKVLKQWKDGLNVAPAVVHEMCNVITNPLYAKGISRYVSKDEILDERELLTDYIAKIITKK